MPSANSHIIGHVLSILEPQLAFLSNKDVMYYSVKSRRLKNGIRKEIVDCSAWSDNDRFIYQEKVQHLILFMLPCVSEAVRAFNDESHKLYSGAML